MITSPMLAKNYDGRDPTGWYMSEKLDGVRAIWNPEDRKLYSRTGKEFIPPDGWTDEFTGTPLDGELWMGRSQFNVCSGMVRRKTEQNWDDIVYRVFDIPSSQMKYKYTYGFLSALTKIGVKNVELVEQTACMSREHLLEFEQEILAKGGEGVMLRNPNSVYQQGRRSWDLMKVKRFHDAEAIVIGYTKGTGKYEGVMGALVCDYVGHEIFIGTGFNDTDRASPPPKHSIIKFKYFELEESGAPRFPVYLGLRED